MLKIGRYFFSSMKILLLTFAVTMFSVESFSKTTKGVWWWRGADVANVEPHQDRQLSNERKWQLYADFVLRAASDVHAAGEKIEWDIPFWLDNIRVAFAQRNDVPLLDVVMGCSDCVALMSYRDTAKAILDISKTELDIASKGGVRIVLGAETGETGEGSLVTFFEEGANAMDVELAKVVSTLQKAKIPLGAGIAIHHLGSWEKLIKKEKSK